jgi:hypothetical protein
MPVCQFYLQGTCRYGSQCRFQHGTDTEAQGYRQRGKTYRFFHILDISCDLLAPQYHPRPRAPMDPKYKYIADVTVSSISTIPIMTDTTRSILWSSDS